MKKLLSSKKNPPKCECDAWFGLGDPPKRTVTSAWNIRNDSSNISSILRPQVCTSSSKQGNESKGVYKKCLLSENTCYCKEKTIRPKLLSRPKTCLSLEKLKRQLGTSDLTRRPVKNNLVLQQCLCRDADVASQNNSTDVALLEDVQEELPEKFDGLKHTQSRKDYELFRREKDEEYLKELEDYHVIEDNAKEQEEKRDESYSLSTILGTKLDTTKTTSSYRDSPDPSPRPMDDLTAFRSEHYFETHSATDLEKSRGVRDHTCVHKFKLDDRLLPEPLNVDPFGRSRCTICSKPMQGDTVQLSRSYFSDRPSRTSLRNLAKCSELGLVPRSISIGGDRSKIELRVDADEKRKFGMFVGKIRRPEYFNTFALRQQKMGCY